MEHCANFDPTYEGCRECPGKVIVTEQDGAAVTICRAGEKIIAQMKATAENGVPVYPVPFPNPLPPLRTL